MNQTIAAICFMTIWIIGMIIFGKFMDITPNYASQNRDEPCKISGHPLWNDC